MRKVTIESPLAPKGERYGNAPEDMQREYEENLAYARAAMLDCFKRGEAPFASHLLYPQILDDADPEERKTGMRAGLHIGDAMDVTVVYGDLGVSIGMKSGIGRAEKKGRFIEYRTLDRWRGMKTGPLPRAHGTQWSTGRKT